LTFLELRLILRVVFGTQLQYTATIVRIAMAKIDQKCLDELRVSLRNIPPLVLAPDSIKRSVADLREAKQLEIHVLWLHHLDKSNGKRFSVAELLFAAQAAGRIEPGSILIMAGSGNAVLNAAYSARAVGADGVIAVVSKTIPEGKKTQFLMAGCKLAYPRDGQTPIERAAELQAMGYGVFINQYEEPAAIDGQKKGPMSHVIREMARMKKSLSFFSAAAGTCATICAAELLKEAYPWMQIIGVGCEDKIVPGARTLADIQRDIKFDWRKAIGEGNELVLCDQASAFARSRDFVLSEGLLFGPTCGLAVEGLLRRFRALSESKELERYINPDGKYVAVVPSMDMSIVYEEYNAILGLEKQALVN
jgi:cysteine synthase